MLVKYPHYRKYTCGSVINFKVEPIFITPSVPGQMAIREMDYYISEAYVSGTFDSCENVRFGPSSDLALPFLCNFNQDCTAHILFNNLGSISNGQAPFQINYLYQTEDEVNGFIPMNASTVKCSEPVDPDAVSLIFPIFPSLPSMEYNVIPCIVPKVF